MRVVVVAYKIAPNIGSEDESGFQLLSAIAPRVDDLTIVTRQNNLQAMREYGQFRDCRLVGLELPRVAVAAKRRFGLIHPFYYAWSARAAATVSQLCRESTVDVVHFLNFHTDSKPFHFFEPGPRVVWGPIAHHEMIPFGWARRVGRMAMAGEALRQVGRQLSWRDPLLARAIDRADTILYANRAIAPPFEKAVGKITVQPYGGAFPGPVRASRDHTGALRIVTAGRLVAIKGFHIALLAFAEFLRRRGRGAGSLEIIGRGPLDGKLHRLAGSLGILEPVTFVPWLRRERFLEQLSLADCFLYPSIEAQGLVVSEALASGLPVISLDGTGPSVLAEGAGVEPVAGRDERHIIPAIVSRLEHLADHKAAGTLHQLRGRAVQRAERDLHWRELGACIMRHYED